MHHQSTGVLEAEKFWDHFTSSASIHPANLYRYQLISDIIKELGSPSNEIVDLGCGNGALLEHINNSKVRSILIGIDGADSIIKQNQQRLPFARFYQADLQQPETFPLKNKADIVVCSEVIEHMPHYTPVFQIAYNLLNPGGYFILTTQGGKRRLHDKELLGHLRHYDIHLLGKEVESFGFQLYRKKETGWPVLNLQKIAASMFMKQVAVALASDEKPTLFFKIVCKIVKLGLKVSSKNKGPQLIIVAKKPL